MKKNFKWFIAAVALFGVSASALHAARTDLLAIQGSGSLRNKDVFHIDSNGSARLYNGDVFLGDAGTSPSIVAGGYPGYKVPFVNGSGATMVQGSVVLSSPTATTTGVGTTGAVTSTTTVIGVCDATVTAGSVGFMTVSGYALVLTTGTVVIGNVLVSSAASSGNVGYAGGTATPTTGTDLGVAMSSGTAAGGLTLVKLR